MNIRFAHFAGLLLSIFCASILCAQKMEDIRFETLDTEDGFSNNWLMGMALDSAGFLWVGTRDGLNRYDGQVVRVFRNDKRDSTSLMDNYGQDPFVDHKGRLWVSYYSGGFSRYDEGCQCFINYRPSETPGGIPKQWTPIRYFVSDDTLIYSGTGQGISLLDLRTGKTTKYDLPNLEPNPPNGDNEQYNAINWAYRAPDGLFWMASTNGLYSFDLKTGQISYKGMWHPGMKHPRPDCFVRIYPHEDKGFWLPSWGNGIGYYDKKKENFSFYRYDSLNQKGSVANVVYDMLPKNEREFWVVTLDKGLAVFDQTSHRFYLNEELLNVDGASSVLALSRMVVARDGVMFMLNPNGILKYNPRTQIFRFKSLHLQHSQSENDFNINDILEAPGGHTVYFGTALGNGVNVLDTLTGQSKSYAVDGAKYLSREYMLVKKLLLDKEGTLWVLAKDYLYQLDKKRDVLKRIATANLGEGYSVPVTFRNMLQAPNGDIWLVSDQGGLHKWMAKEGRFSQKLNDKSISPEAPSTVKFVAFDADGKMWLSGGGQMATFDPSSGKFTWPFGRETPSWGKGNEVGMAADKMGNIWLAVNKVGLLKIEPGNAGQPRYTLLSDTSGLPTNRIFNMNTDPRGNVWLSTIMGVLYLNSQDLSWRKFTQAVGMEKDVLSLKFISCANGSFYIVAPTKYCKVDLDFVNQPLPLPKVYLDKFSVFNIERPVPLDAHSTIVLHPHENVFSFEFGCIDFTNQAFNQFEYQLVGWDHDWILAGNRRYASYTNLEGGDYVFRVRVANAEGAWGEPVSVNVHIETPFYKRAWFIALALLFFTGLIYALYYFRVRQIQETERLKTEFNRQLAESRMEALRAQMNPHFIFNCLNSINRYIIKNDIKTSSTYLTRFAKLIRLILDNSKHKMVLLSNELEALRLYVDMESLRFDHKFAFEVMVDDNVATDYLEVPPLIIQPYVENAIWHGLLHKEDGQGFLSIHISQQANTLICTITDNGIGRAAAAAFKKQNSPTRQSIGMKLTEERLRTGYDTASQAVGTQKIIDLFDENGKPCGTKVILEMPVVS